jgi:aspartate carbamoyltransferase catalytic subunit
MLTSPHLLGIKDLDAESIHLIVKTAKEFKEVLNRPIKKVPSLRDVTIANVFFENSTRTRLSFELAEKDCQPIRSISQPPEVQLRKEKPYWTRSTTF